MSTLRSNIQPPVQPVPEYGQPEGNDVRAALLEYFNRQDE